MIYPDALETLTRLVEMGLRLGIVSSHPQVHLEREAQEHGFHTLVEAIHGDARNKVDALQHVCSLLGLEPTTTLYIGDTIYDIRSAREAGLQTAGITTGYHTHEALEAEKPEFLLTSLNQIFSIIL